MSDQPGVLAKIGKALASNFLLWVPLLLWVFPVAAYWEYGLGKQLYLMLAIMIPVLAIITFVMVRYHLQYREAYQDNTALLTRLTQEGVKVRATIVDVQQSNAFVNEMPVLKITFEYNMGGEMFSKTTAKVVSFDNLHHISEGSTRWVWVDKQNPRVVVFP